MKKKSISCTKVLPEGIFQTHSIKAETDFMPQPINEVEFNFYKESNL